MLSRSRLSRTLEIAIELLAKLRIRINPYYIFLEEITGSSLPHMEKGFEEYNIHHLGPQHMKIIAAMPARKPSEKELLNRLKKGNICIGVKHAGEFVAFSWYDLMESNIKGEKVKLKENEAYLFDIYTLPSYRGKGLAPYLRYQLYRELDKLGRHKLYSFSDYFNTPAIRFKEKLNAKKTELRLILSFKRWRINMRLKKYNE